MQDPLIELFANVLRVDPTTLSDGSTPENTTNWDSLNAMRLVTHLEEAFDVQLTTREIVKMRSIGIAREVLKKKGANV